MPIHVGTPMDENPPGAEPSVILTATYALIGGEDPGEPAIPGLFFSRT